MRFWSQQDISKSRDCTRQRGRMKRTSLVLQSFKRAIPITAFFLCVVGGSVCHAQREYPSDVRSIVEHRQSLTGQRVTIIGFLSRWHDFFFIKQGQRRSSNDLGMHGEQYRCNFTGSPKYIWFSPHGAMLGSLREKLPDDGSMGRRVIIAGILNNQTSGVAEDVDIERFGPEDMAQQSIGPLTHVRVIRVVNDRCEGAGG